MKTLVLVAACLFLTVPSVAAEPAPDAPDCDAVPILPSARCMTSYAFDTLSEAGASAPDEVRDPAEEALNLTEETAFEAFSTAQDALVATVQFTCHLFFGSDC